MQRTQGHASEYLGILDMYSAAKAGFTNMLEEGTKINSFQLYKLQMLCVKVEERTNPLDYISQYQNMNLQKHISFKNTLSTCLSIRVG